jgi:hypothetical protein
MKRLYSLVFTLLVFSVLLSGCSLIKQHGDSGKTGGEVELQKNKSNAYILSVEPPDGSKDNSYRELPVKIKFSDKISLQSINANPSLPVNIYVVPSSEIDQVRNLEGNPSGAIFDCAISKQPPGISFILKDLKEKTDYTILIWKLLDTNGNEIPEYTSTFTTY